MVGIYHTDAEARVAYEGYSGAKHQGFKKIGDAQQYIRRWSYPTAVHTPDHTYNYSAEPHHGQKNSPPTHGKGQADSHSRLLNLMNTRAAMLQTVRLLEKQMQEQLALERVD